LYFLYVDMRFKHLDKIKEMRRRAVG